MKKLVLLILFCFSFFSYSMEKKLYKKYYNQRFGYSIDVCVENLKENLEEREFFSLEKINDNYPKYIISMDEFDMSRNGIRHINIIDFLIKS